MRWTRQLSALAIVLGLQGLPDVANSVTVAPPPTAAPAAPLGFKGDDRGHDLAEDVVRPATTRFGIAARIRKWPGRTIRYYESIPKKWDWSLDRGDRALERQRRQDHGSSRSRGGVPS